MPASVSANHFDRRAWLSAGMEMLCSAGVQSLSIEALAKRQNISKGSFYWHFRDREDLLESILDEWQARQGDWGTTGDSNQSPVERWARLLETFAEPGYASLELAISTWARQDQNVACRVADADRKRVHYLAEIFREIGLSQGESEEWANAAFCLYLGWMDRAMRGRQNGQDLPALAELLSRLVLAASALASQEALRQSKR